MEALKSTLTNINDSIVPYLPAPYQAWIYYDQVHTERKGIYKQSNSWLVLSNKIYSFEEQSDREKTGETENEEERDLLPAGSLLKWFQKPVLGQAEATSLKLYLGLPVGCRNPTTWTMICWFPGCISIELDHKWNSKDSNQCSRGMSVFQGWLNLMHHNISPC